MKYKLIARWQYLKVTCAACHTAEIHINGKHHLIDGAPNNADFYAFIQELSRSLLDTANQDAKFARFAARVSGDGSLRDELQQTATHFASYVEHSTPDEPWGKARMDAVALIVNEMAYKQGSSTALRTMQIFMRLSKN